MARAIVSKETWLKVKEYFEHGLPLSDIQNRTGISRGSISRKSKSEGWSKATSKQQLLDDAVGVSVAKATMNDIELHIFEELHSEIVNPRIFFGGTALKSQIIANKILLDIEDRGVTQEDINTLEAHSRITQRNKETVLGKDKTTDITNVNAQKNEQKVIEVVYRS